MKELNVGSLGGIHYEMYEPDPESLHTEKILRHIEGKPEFLDLNGVFWSELMSEEQIASLVDDFLISRHGFKNPEPYEQMIQTVPELFKRTVREAKERLCDQGLEEQEYFGYLETLAIVCRLYSRMYFSPHELTVHEGFLLDSQSSLEMLDDCLVPSRNPYYQFLNRHVWKVLRDMKPECVWINGRMTVANMAIAKYLREKLPDVKIFWALPGSEYYATNKIDQYLQYNTPLFSVIDGVVLEDFENTRNYIVQALIQGRGLDGVYNLMYCVRDGAKGVCIYKNPYKKYPEGESGAIEVDRRAVRPEYHFKVAPWEIMNVKLFPQKICSWNKCTFCGINKKYKVSGQESGIQDKVRMLTGLEAEGCRYFWSIDEEISAEQLETLAQSIIDAGIHMRWQTRARISKQFAQVSLCRILAASGLREIRFGLESASRRVLALMNKFDDDFSLRLVEQIVSAFHEAGISVHFPVIVGFPGETDMEREQTYQFLKYLRSKYEDCTFNVNVLGLDISSPLFKNWQQYGITRISFPCNPNYFLGNLVGWDCAETPFMEERLKLERDAFMREQLYSWMPEDSLVYPHIFYRLMETIRNTLVVKDRKGRKKDGGGRYEEKKKLIWNPFAVICGNMCYNVKRHQKVISSVDMGAIKEMFEKPVTVDEALKRLSGCLLAYTNQHVRRLMAQFCEYDFLIEAEE